MSKVSITRCSSYDIVQVRQAVKRSLDDLGGMQAFVNPGDRVLLKVNLLMRRRPDKATTTHPAVVQAIAEMVMEAGGKPIICDSPGGYSFHTQSTLDSLYETCGMKEAARMSGAELNYNTEVLDSPYPSGRMIKNIMTIRPALNADKIINIPKLKTHMMMVLSCAVKNLFGIVPGRHKTEYHFRFEDENDFAGVIVDICQFAKPILTVVDAIVAMEGNGPANGSPRNVGLIMAGTNPYELDVVASSSIGLEPKSIPTIRESVRRGLCSGKLEDTEIVGEEIKDVAIVDFAKPENHVEFNIYNWLLPKFIAKRLNKALKFKPVFKHADCRSCGICAKSCPAKAIQMNNDRPAVDLNKCISCFCCHELCDFNAVDIRKPWIMRLLFR